MISIKRTDSSNADFISLVSLLDQDLAKSDGDDHAFYHQFNSITSIKHVVVLYSNGEACSCGSIKELEPGVMELKRMFTLKEKRGKGLATKLLSELETWAKELSYQKCILETGVNQPDAIRLYEKNGFERIPNYGQYKGVENSFCFGKTL